MKRYHLSADILRSAAMFGVIIIHTANAVFARPDFIGGISWWFALSLNAMSRISIPLFIMVSGYLILQKDESPADTWRRMYYRLIVPLLFWFTLRIVWNNGSPVFSGIHQVLFVRFLTANVMDLYFFVILAGLYGIAPFLRAFFRAVRSRQQELVIAVCLVLCGIAYYAIDFFINRCSSFHILSYWLPYAGFFASGYVFGRYKAGNPVVLGVLYAAAFTITLVGGYAYFVLRAQGNQLLSAGNCLNFYTDSYASLNVAVMALSLYTLVMHTKFACMPKIARIFVRSVARHSLAIYVLHSFVLQTLDRYHVFDFPMPAWTYVIVKCTSVFFVSYGMASILMRVPFLRFAFGERRVTE